MREGASVVVADINVAAAERVAGDLPTAVAAEVDVSDEQSVVRMVETAVQTFGGLDVLHNNASDISTTARDTDVDPLSSPARVWLALLNPQVAREFGIVAADLLDEALGVLEADERLDRVAQRMIRRSARVDDHVDDHAPDDDSSAVAGT